MYAYFSDLSDQSGKNIYVVLDHILDDNNYVETTEMIRYYKIDSETEMWDALGESQSLTLWEE